MLSWKGNEILHDPYFVPKEKVDEKSANKGYY